MKPQVEAIVVIVRYSNIFNLHINESHTHLSATTYVRLIDFVESCSFAICFWGTCCFGHSFHWWQHNKASQPAEHKLTAVWTSGVCRGEQTNPNGEWQDSRSLCSRSNFQCHTIPVDWCADGKLKQMAEWEMPSQRAEDEDKWVAGKISVSPQRHFKCQSRTASSWCTGEPGGGSCVMLIYSVCNSRHWSWDTSLLCVITISVVALRKDNPSLCNLKSSVVVYKTVWSLTLIRSLYT